MSYYGASAHFLDHLERVRLLRAGCDANTLCTHTRVLSAREHAALPLVGFRRRAGLTRQAFDLLMIAAFAEEALTIEELVAVLSRTATAEPAILAELTPNASLIAHRLVSVVDGRVRVEPRVVAFLRGSRALDARLADVVELRELAPATVDPTPTAQVAREIAHRSPLIVEGPSAIGKTSVIVAAAALRGMPALILDLDRCNADQLAIAHREALLLDAVFVMRARSWSLASPVLRRRALELIQEGVAILTVRDGTEPARVLRGARRIRVGLPPVSLRQRIWMSLLPTGAASLVTFDLCVRYPLPPGEIARALANACEQATRDNRELTVGDLERAAREQQLDAIRDARGVLCVVATTALPGGRQVQDPRRQSAENPQAECELETGTKGALPTAR